MQTHNPSHRSRHRASVAAWLAAMLGAAILVALTAVAGVWSLLHVGGETAILRDGALASSAADAHKEIEVSVGPLLFGMARAGLSFVDLDPEVHAALGAVRGASVGVYRLDSTGVDRAEMIASVDRAMSRHGWDRLLAVLENRECVLAYVPAEIPSPRDVRVSVLVLDGDQLVVTSVRANPEPLFDLALREARRSIPLHSVTPDAATGHGKRKL